MAIITIIIVIVAVAAITIIFSVSCLLKAVNYKLFNIIDFTILAES